MFVSILANFMQIALSGLQTADNLINANNTLINIAIAS